MITGARGQLGSELLYCLNSGQTELGPIPSQLVGATVYGLDIEQLDIGNLQQVLELVNKLQPHLIINCAAFTNVDGCETQQETALQVNALGARNIAIAAEQTGAKLVHISTDYVFSGDSKTAYAEEDICAPKSEYGRSKYLGEQYIRDFCNRYFIVRTAWLYGYEGSNFIKTMLRLGKENAQVKVVCDQIGTPTNVADLIHHLLKIAVTQEYGIYHCTNNGQCSWYDFACKIFEYADMSVQVISCTTAEYPTPAQRPLFSVLDNQMLRLTVGDEMRPWETALESFIKKLSL